MNDLTISAGPTFDPDLAVLPIMVATWDDDPVLSTIVYQNSVQQHELGSWTGRSFFD